MSEIVIEERDEDAAYDEARQRELDEATDALRSFEDALKRKQEQPCS